LEPVDVDVDTGYRRYAAEQIATAQIIRRFRDLDMPLEDIQIVLRAPDVETRNQVIANHLGRLESSLTQTQEAVTSLRELLHHPQTSPAIDHRHLTATPAPVITEIVDKADAVAWYRGAIGELVATLSAQDISPDHDWASVVGELKGFAPSRVRGEFGVSKAGRHSVFRLTRCLHGPYVGGSRLSSAGNRRLTVDSRLRLNHEAVRIRPVPLRRAIRRMSP
jgi:DNA-binding transcriptional MerR regulator